MKRLVLCCAMLAAIIGLAVVSLNMLKKSGEELYDSIDCCLKAYYSGSGEVFDEIERIEQNWGSYYVKASYLTRSASLDDISCSVAKLEPLLKADCDEFASELNSIRYRVFLIYEAQIPHFRSVF